MLKGTFVPLETLERWLACMEADWLKIDLEWGPTPGGLEPALRLGQYPEISEVREAIQIAKLTSNVELRLDTMQTRCIAACESERLEDPCKGEDEAYERAITHCIAAIQRLPNNAI